MTYDLLQSGISLGPMQLRNRVVMGAMHTRIEEMDQAEERLAAFYRERAAGGVALIVTGGHAPNEDGRIDATSPILCSESQVPAHRAVCEVVHLQGAKIALQILHAGRYAKHAHAVGPSPVRSPISREEPRGLSTAEVWATVADFATTARLAVAAGYDAVEVMGSEGYLVNQFVCRRTNHRSDEFGGTWDRRLRFPLAVVAAVREAIGSEIALIYRISALDLVDEGLDASEVLLLARAVEGAGADALSTGIGWHESTVPTIAASVPRATWAFAARHLKEAVGIPVIASNRINTPQVAEDLLSAGDADLVSLARPLLADPRFVEKAIRGQSDEIAVCIGCNQSCLDRVLSDSPATCLVNPRAGRELEFPATRSAPRRMCVIGAGPAGLSFAVAAAERGHVVTLLEASGTVGGQLTMARRVPGKSEFDELLRYLTVRVARLGVDLRLRTPATLESLAAGGFDDVVVATGVTPRVPAIPGIRHPKVLSYVDVLRDNAHVGRSVAIIGAGGIAFDVAEFLVGDPRESLDINSFLHAWGVDAVDPWRRAPLDEERDGRNVTMLQRSHGRAGARLSRSTGWITRSRLARAGVGVMSGVDYQGIDDEGLHYVGPEGRGVLAVDTVIVCAGQESERTLLSELAARGLDPHVIGGARAAIELDCASAIDEATRLAWSL